MKPRQILNVLAVLITLMVNWLATALPLNGIDTGQISDSFPVLFTPAGYVFSIWGLIYTGLIGFAIYQALPAQRDNPRLDRISPWFLASNVFNSVWLFFWHYGQFVLTEIAMLGLLVSLIAIYVQLGIGRRPVGLAERLLVNLPFSIYLGWISVATIANTSIVLYDLGWNGGSLGPVPWTVGVLLVATGLGTAMILLRREVAYPLVLVWAFIGIIVKQGDVQAAGLAAGFGAAALLLLLAARMLGWLPIFQPTGSLRKA